MVRPRENSERLSHTGESDGNFGVARQPGGIATTSYKPNYRVSKIDPAAARLKHEFRLKPVTPRSD